MERHVLYVRTAASLSHAITFATFNATVIATKRAIQRCSHICCVTPHAHDHFPFVRRRVPLWASMRSSCENNEPTSLRICLLSRKYSTAYRQAKCTCVPREYLEHTSDLLAHVSFPNLDESMLLVLVRARAAAGAPSTLLLDRGQVRECHFPHMVCAVWSLDRAKYTEPARLGRV